ncbi:hypothetical protein SCA6_016041 [Theobroma cacao]
MFGSNGINDLTEYESNRPGLIAGHKEWYPGYPPGELQKKWWSILNVVLESGTQANALMLCHKKNGSRT